MPLESIAQGRVMEHQAHSSDTLFFASEGKLLLPLYFEIPTKGVQWDRRQAL